MNASKRQKDQNSSILPEVSISPEATLSSPQPQIPISHGATLSSQRPSSTQKTSRLASLKSCGDFFHSRKHISHDAFWQQEESLLKGSVRSPKELKEFLRKDESIREFW